MRLVVLFLIALFPLSAAAQDRDSHFADYGAYSDFVDRHIGTRNFIELIQVLGGRDEYTIEQLQGLQSRFLSIYPSDFSGRAVARETELGQGFRQEMRIYWSAGSGYLYFYAMLHDRSDAMVVLSFTLNSDVSKVMAEF